MKEIWQNKKNGKLYQVLNYEVINCTNAQNGEKMYLYRVCDDERDMLFVRSEREFLEKFTKVDEK